MKIKRSVGVPAALLLYLVAIGIYAWPGRNPEISYGQWAGVVVVTSGCIVALHFMLRKREKQREKEKMDKSTE